ncbi:hypothetical protein OIO90_002419 [Microbotryomycetes sp. JL221]|nr:hypothetical protein OIO90_002419 [Microbotryomycetes sp. JL221]
MSQASPYLLSLGVSKASMAIVFLAGPLSGLIVQPVVGVLSDRCRSSLGRRRPFIIGGTIVSSLSIMLLGWSKEVAQIVTTKGTSAHTSVTIALAILAVYVVDFSINVVQAMDRALLVDVVPPNQQPAANAWASRLMGLGAVLGFWLGGLDLVGWTGGWFGDEQLKFSSWIGWFPILFFATTWVAEIYVRDIDDASDLATASAAVQEDATRAGTRAMFFHALVSLLTSIVMPPLISTTDSRSFKVPSTTSARFGWLEKLKHDVAIPWLTLPVLWLTSNALFAVALLSTWFTTSVTGASFLIALVGVCWAVTQWAPFAILGDLILRVDAPSASHGMSEHVHGNWGTAMLSPIDEESSQYTASMHLKSPSTPAQQTFALDKGRLRADSDAQSFDSSGQPLTPPSVASSEYYDTAMDTPDRSTFGDDSPGHIDTARLPDLPESPAFVEPANEDAKTPKPTNRFRAPSTNLTTQHPYRLPPNNHTLFSRNSYEDQRDPYASTSTLRVNTMTPRVLQVRHSDDTFEGSEFESGHMGGDDDDGNDDDDGSDHGTMRGKLDSRRGSANSIHTTMGAHDSYNNRQSPAIVFQTDDNAWDSHEDEMSMMRDEGFESNGAGERAGVILGCHNIYLVIPQFLVSALSSLIFALFAPHHTVVGHGPRPLSPVAAPALPTPLSSDVTSTVIEAATDALVRVVARESDSRAKGTGWDALGMVFRIGGVSAFVSCWFCWRLVRESRNR